METKDLAYRSRYVQNMLLSIKWSYVGPKHVNFAINVYPGKKNPQSDHPPTESNFM